MSDFFNYIIDRLNAMANWAMEFVEYLLSHLGALLIDLARLSMETVVSIVTTLLTELAFFTEMEIAWTGLDPQIRAYAEIMNVPEVITIYISAYIVSLLVKLLPGV